MARVGRPPAGRARVGEGQDRLRARSSAIHAFDLEAYEQDGAEWVRFSVHPWQRSDEDHVELALPVLDRREVRSSNGQVEQRYAVSLDVRLAGRTITTVMTLSNRDEMGFRMLIGREALRARLPRRLVEVVRRRQAAAGRGPPQLGQGGRPSQEGHKVDQRPRHRRADQHGGTRHR